MRVSSDVQSCKRCPLFTSMYAVRLRIFSEDLRTRPIRGRVIIITVIGLHDVYCVRFRAKPAKTPGFTLYFVRTTVVYPKILRMTTLVSFDVVFIFFHSLRLIQSFFFFINIPRTKPASLRRLLGGASVILLRLLLLLFRGIIWSRFIGPAAFQSTVYITAN